MTGHPTGLLPSEDRYDYIIVGGGRAGLLLAARLSEDGQKSIMVVEAGPDRRQEPRIIAPEITTSLSEDGDYEWSFLKQPVTSLDGRLIAYPRERAAPTGSSSINFYWCPYATGFKTWSRLGNRDVGWRSSASATSFPVAETLKAFTTPAATGEYSAPFFLSNLNRKRSLHILTECVVDKIELDMETEMAFATGVLITRKSGERETIQLKEAGEVILTTGAIRSPQLLELSGIGNPTVLGKSGIITNVDSPGVGENLQDHVFVATSYELADGKVAHDLLRNSSFLRVVREEHQDEWRGRLASSRPESLNFASLPPVSETGKLDSEEMEELCDAFINTNSDEIPAGKARQYEALRVMLTDQKEATADYIFLPTQLAKPLIEGATRDGSGTDEPNSITIATKLNHPLSRGSVHIGSADTTKNLRVDPKHLSHPFDLELLAEHARYTDKLVMTALLRNLLKPNGRKTPHDIGNATLPRAKELVKEHAFAAFQPSGTCAMMPQELGGVVNGRFVVYGTRNIRVADASVFPLRPIGCMQGAVCGVAERVADIIREDAFDWIAHRGV